MKNDTLICPCVRRFLLEHLVAERNLSRNTQRSYRDTLRLLIPFAADHHRTAVDRLVVTEVSADVVRGFLRDIEELTTEEAAAALGITPNAVKIRLHRARQALATLLRRRLGNRPPEPGIEDASCRTLSAVPSLLTSPSA